MHLGKSNLGGKKEQEIKEQYQEKLNRMDAELKQLKAALKRHTHVIKSKVFCYICMFIFTYVQLCM